LSLDFSKNQEHKKKHIYIGHRQKVNNESEPFYKGGAVKRLLKPRFSEEIGVLYSQGEDDARRIFCCTLFFPVLSFQKEFRY
jgi:hypothetical protein